MVDRSREASDRFPCGPASNSHANRKPPTMSTLEAPATAQGLRAPRLTQFLGPRYWLTWLFVGWLRLTAALPWQVAIVIHRWIGRAVWHLLPGRRLCRRPQSRDLFPGARPAGEARARTPQLRKRSDLRRRSRHRLVQPQAPAGPRRRPRAPRSRAREGQRRDPTLRPLHDARAHGALREAR